MIALVGRLLAFGFCVFGALAYGIVNELEEIPDSLDRAVGVGSVLSTGVLLAVLHRRAGVSLLLGAPFLSVIWAAVALGDFVPFALGLGGRILNRYDYDMAWKVFLMLKLFTLALGGLLAGLLSAAIAACILAAGRHRMPGGGIRRPLP